MRRNYTLPLANVNGLYSIFFMPVFAYSTVYLLSLGLSNSQIGMLLAGTNLLAVIAQPMVASIADHRTFSHRTLLLAQISLICLQCLLLIIATLPLWVHAAVFAGNILLLYSMQPLVSAMAVDIMARGAVIDFGIARAASSLSYAASAMVFGVFLARRGMPLIPVTMLFAGLILFLSLYFFRPILDPLPEKKERVDLRTHFFARYPIFIPVMLGVICIYFNYSVFNNYAIHVVRALGGASSELGIALAIASFSEVPALMAFSYLYRRFGATRLFQLSALFFGVKTLLTLLSGSMGMLYFAQTVQSLSFGLYSTSSVYFVERIMQPVDRSKGQAKITSAATLGNVLAALVGGYFLDHYGIRLLLITALIVSTIGALLILGATRVRKRRIPQLPEAHS